MEYLIILKNSLKIVQKPSIFQRNTDEKGSRCFFWTQCIYLPKTNHTSIINDLDQKTCLWLRLIKWKPLTVKRTE